MGIVLRSSDFVSSKRCRQKRDDAQLLAAAMAFCARLVWDVGRADPRGSERLGEREGGVKVELKPRDGRTEGLGGFRGFLAFPGRIRTRGGPFRVLSGT